MSEILDSKGLQHYVNKMCNADNRKVGEKSLPTVLNEIDIAIDGFKNVFEQEYSNPVNMEITNNQNIFTIGAGNNADKKNDVENSFTNLKISGNSLVNLANEWQDVTNATITGYYGSERTICELSRLKSNTWYTLILNYQILPSSTIAYNMMELGLSNSKNITVAHPIASQTACQFAIKNGLNIIRIHLSDYKHDQYTYLTIRPIRRYTAPVAGESVTFSCFNAILLEGDYTNKSIPEYFEGLQSVGEKENNNHRINITSINKNIVLDSAELKNKNNEWVTYNGTITEGYLNNVGYTIKYSGTGAYVDSLQQLIYDRNTNQNKILPDTWYTLSFYAKGNYLTTHVYPSLIDTNVKGFINGTETALRADGYGRHTLTNTWKRITYTFKTKVDLTSLTSNNYLLFRAMPNDNSVVSCIMLEQRKIATEYKPQLVDNRIILLNEPLRGLPNGVKDTIEKINGEWKLIRRCGEIILDGSQDWYGAARVNGLSWAMQLKNKVACKSIGCCDTLPIRNMYYYSNKNISCLSPDNITITLPDSDTTLSASSSESAINNGIKQWLKHNPTKVIYELVVPIIEDIDPITVQCWKNGMIAIDEILPVETTHMVALNKSAQIQKNIEELTMLKNRVETLEEQYNRTALNQAYEVELLKLDMKLDDII